MSKSLPNLVFNSDSNEVFLGRDYGHVENYSDGVAETIDREVKEIVITVIKSQSGFSKKNSMLLKRSRMPYSIKKRLRVLNLKESISPIRRKNSAPMMLTIQGVMSNISDFSGARKSGKTSSTK